MWTLILVFVMQGRSVAVDHIDNFTGQEKCLASAKFSMSQHHSIDSGFGTYHNAYCVQK